MPRFKAFASDSEDEGSSSSRSVSPEIPTRDFPPAKPAPAAVAQRPPPITSQSSSSASEEEEESEEEDSGDVYEPSEMDEDETTTEEEELRQTEPKTWAKQLDLEPARVHVMQSSLFRTSESTKPAQERPSGFLKQPRPLQSRQDLQSTTNRASFTQPRAQPPARKYVRVSGSESKTFGRESVYLDSGLSMGRSFRVGWGPGNQLVHVGKLQSRNSSSSCVLSFHLLNPG